MGVMSCEVTSQFLVLNVLKSQRGSFIKNLFVGDLLAEGYTSALQTKSRDRKRDGRLAPVTVIRGICKERRCKVAFDASRRGGLKLM